MNITNVTDYINMPHDEYNNNLTTNNNCTSNENNFDITIPTLLTLPCGLFILCLMSLTVYTLIKPLFNKKQIPTIILDYMYNCMCIQTMEKIF